MGVTQQGRQQEQRARVGRRQGPRQPVTATRHRAKGCRMTEDRTPKTRRGERPSKLVFSIINRRYRSNPSDNRLCRALLVAAGHHTTFLKLPHVNDRPPEQWNPADYETGGGYPADFGIAWWLAADSSADRHLKWWGPSDGDGRTGALYKCCV